MLQLTLRNSVFLGVTFLLLAGCGGGGSGNGDTTAPTATVTTDAPAAPDPALIPEYTVITVQFSESMDTTVGSWSLSGDLASDSDGGVWSQTSAINDTLTISPSTGWFAKPQRQLIINARDLAGNPVASINLKYDVYRGQLYYVDWSRPDDSGAGFDPPSAKKNIYAMAAAATPSATVLVRAGNYPVNHALGTHVVLREGVSLYGGYNADFSQRDPTVNITTIEDQSNTAVTFNTLSHGAIVSSTIGLAITPATVIDGFTIQGSTQSGADYTAAIFLDGASPTVQHNTINGGSGSQGSSGMFIYNNASPVVQHNTINGGSSSTGSSFGVFIYVNASPVVQHNTIHGGGSSFTSIGMYSAYYAAPNVQNNTIHGGNGKGTTGFMIVGSSPVVHNNTIYGGAGANSSAAIELRPTWTDANPDISNNILFTRTGSVTPCVIEGYDPGGNNPTPATLRNNDLFNCSVIYSDAQYGCTGNADGDNNAATCTIDEMNALTDIANNGGNISVDPLFVDINTDWHFSATSPSSVTAGGLNGIDAGWSFTDDLDGVTRPASGTPWSIGAYEP